MKTKIFQGNLFEIGQQQGEIYKEKGMSFDKIKIDSVLYKKQLAVYKNWKNLEGCLSVGILTRKN